MSGLAVSAGPLQVKVYPFRLAVETLVRKYEGAMLRETLREALTEAYLMGAQNILGQLR